MDAERLLTTDIDVRTISPLTLAFVGDGVYGLMVRELLTVRANRSSGELHRMSVEMVRAEAQSAAAEKILHLLSEKELGAYKRGRNAHTSRSGKDYHSATGLEALFGYLYLSGDIPRLRELFRLCTGE